MPLAGRPFLSFMLDWLRGHGVDEVLLSCGFLAHAVADVLGDEFEGMRLIYVNEDSPLGTAGPMRLAEDEGLLADRLLVLNGDVLTDMDLTTQIAFHDDKGAAATLALDRGGRHRQLRRRAHQRGRQRDRVPREVAGAGADEPDQRRGLRAGAKRGGFDPLRALGLLRARGLPRPGGNGLYGFHSEGYWIDIGTPERYLESTYDLLAGRVDSTLPARDEMGSLVYEPALTAGAHVGPQSVLGPHCSVGADSTVDRSVLHSRVTVGSGCLIQQSVLAEGVRVGDGAQVGPDAMIGSGAEIAPGEIVEEGARVDPGARPP